MAKSKIKFELWRSGLSFTKGPNGYVLIKKMWGGRRSSQHGRSTADVTCPCCGVITEVYIWSFCGGGKRCRACNVRMGTMGASIDFSDVPEKYLHLFTEQVSITKLQDDDSHWYWIPNDIVQKFESDLSAITGKDYMDCPDLFDDFTENYGHYRTGGDPDNMPQYFKNQL